MTDQHFMRWGEAQRVAEKLNGFWRPVFDRGSGSWKLYKRVDGCDQYASEADCERWAAWFTPAKK